MSPLMLRIIRAIVSIACVVSATFFILRFLPGGPTMLMLDGVNDPELEQVLLHQFGLDRSIWEQFLLFWGELFRGNLGVSFYSGQPVTELLLTRLPWTVLLLGLAFIMSLIVSIPVGVWGAERYGSRIDRIVRLFGVAGQGVFVPALAVLLLVVFSVGFGLFPVGGAVDHWATRSGGLELVLNVLWHLALPLAVLVLIQVGSFALTVRATMLQVFTQDYMVTAAAKGLSRRQVIWKHGVRSGLLPILSLAGLELGALVSGAVLTETVFAYPGLGLFIYESVLRQDYPVLQGAFILVAVGVVLANLVIDALSQWLDPRLAEGAAL